MISRTWRGETAVLPLMLVAAPVLTVLTIKNHMLIICIVGLVALPLIVRSAPTRLVIVLAGALLVFQARGDVLKMAYLGAALLCVAVSLVELGRSRDPVLEAFKPLRVWSMPTLAVLLVSYPIAASFGTGFSPWMRDVLPYLLLVILPLIGLDAGRSIGLRALDVITATMCIAAAIGFGTTWLNRRGATTEVSQVILSSTTLPMLGFCYAIIRTGTACRHRLRWGLAATVIAACLISTGTRTNVVILVSALAAAVGSLGKARIPIQRLLILVPVMVAAMVGLIVVIAGAVGVDQGFFSNRLRVLMESLRGGLDADQSYIIRASSYALAQQRWQDHPWFGGGPGYGFRTSGDFTLDTPWVVPAKFGIVGTAVLIGLLIALAVSIRRTRVAPDPAYSAARCWGFAVMVLTVFGPWLEDKGTALAVTLLVALAARAGRDAREDHRTRASLQEVSARAGPVISEVRSAPR